MQNTSPSECFLPEKQNFAFRKIMVSDWSVAAQDIGIQKAMIKKNIVSSLYKLFQVKFD